jgi:8-hydroxy-5-deazaflavin:NADPH oxidoreductase
MKIGFVGVGHVAQTLSRHFIQAGHEVILSNSRGPESLIGIIRQLGPKARAGTDIDAAAADIVILATQWENAPAALKGINWKDKILVDATNHFGSNYKVVQLGNKTGSEVVAEFAPGAKVLKAFNHVVTSWIQEVPADMNTVLFVAGVDIGSLKSGGSLLQLGGGLNGLLLKITERYKSTEIRTEPFMQKHKLLDSIRLGDLELRNRVVMAPMTRARTEASSHLATDLMAEWHLAER